MLSLYATRFPLDVLNLGSSTHLFNFPNVRELESHLNMPTAPHQSHNNRIYRLKIDFQQSCIVIAIPFLGINSKFRLSFVGFALKIRNVLKQCFRLITSSSPNLRSMRTLCYYVTQIILCSVRKTSKLYNGVLFS